MTSQPPWFDTTKLFRWLLLTLNIGGGFTGLVVTLQGIAESQLSSLQLLFYIWFFGLYILTIASGLMFADSPRCTVPVMILLILQIPFVSSPICEYSFGVGFNLTIGFVSGHLTSNCRFGSGWYASFLQDRPWGIGVNLFAVILLVLLARYSRTLHTLRCNAVNVAPEQPS